MNPEATLDAPPRAKSESIVSPPTRQISVDVYRGFVMFLMMAEVLHFSRVSRALPGNHFWQFLSYHQSHVEWIGCSLHDLIQPSFSFLVGCRTQSQVASRVASGRST